MLPVLLCLHSGCDLGFAAPPCADTCSINARTQGAWCYLREVIVSPWLVGCTGGGESINSTVGQTDGDELPLYAPGAFRKSGTVDVALHDLGKTEFVKDVMEALQDRPTHHLCGSYVHLPTVFTTRYEYANLFHTMLDWYNVFDIMHTMGAKTINVVFLDGHPAGALDSPWSILFGGRVRYVKELDPNVCYRNFHVYSGGHISPLWRRDQYAPQACRLSTFEPFLVHTLEKYNLYRTEMVPEKVVIIDRQPYVAHPRNPTGKLDRIITNLDEWAVLLRQHHWDVELVRLDGTPFRSQLEKIRQARVLIGMHGAGLTHLIFLHNAAAIIEVTPSPHLKMFENLAKWKPRVQYTPVRVLRSSSGRYRVDPALITNALRDLGITPNTLNNSI